MQHSPMSPKDFLSALCCHGGVVKWNTQSDKIGDAFSFVHQLTLRRQGKPREFVLVRTEKINFLTARGKLK